MQALEGPCIVQPCFCTAGYYIGAGQWICWLHALQEGWDKVLEDVGSRTAMGANRAAVVGPTQTLTSWPALNRERGLLIDKQIAGTLTESERKLLDVLQAYADYHIEQVAPRPAPPASLEEL